MKVTPANDGVHKWSASFKNGKTTLFGSKGMDDYTLTRDKAQRDRYRTRHKNDLRTGDPEKAGFLSYYILWGESTSLAKNVRTYEKKFNV